MPWVKEEGWFMELLGHKHQNCRSLIFMMEVGLRKRDSRGSWGEKRNRASQGSKMPLRKEQEEGKKSKTLAI